MRFKLCLSALCLVFAFGCETQSSDPGGGGKADDIDDERCETASVDDNGFCRAADGTFAPNDCCIANEMCAAATIDGTACRAPNGEFAPFACCEPLCAGASMDSSGFCRLPNGQFAFEACCADQCISNDLPPFESGTLPGTCDGACGDESDDGCFCDDACFGFGDCCEDKVAVCGDGGTNFNPNSCEGACGSSPGAEFDFEAECFCDEECAGFGDCCPDKVAVCGGDGSLLPDCDEVACEGAEVDGNGTCRTPDGRFAKSSCCAPPPECATATVDANGFCRRQDNGQFAPSVCCEGICEASFVDRNGFCRNGNGQFANTGCCADVCVERQGRSDRTDRTGRAAACNGAQERAEEVCPAEVEEFIRECAQEQVDLALEDGTILAFIQGVDLCLHTPFAGLGDEPFEVFDDLCLDSPPINVPPDWCADGLENFEFELIPACEVKVLGTID